MPNLPKPAVVVFAKNIARLAQFYREVAAMAVVHADEEHVVLEQAGLQLIVHGIPAKIAGRIRITTPPQVREATPIKPCLPVQSIAQARTSAAPLGGQVGAKDREWTARGFRACDGHDPEGNVFQLREGAD